MNDAEHLDDHERLLRALAGAKVVLADGRTIPLDLNFLAAGRASEVLAWIERATGGVG